MALKIEDLQDACKNRRLLMTKHVQIRCEERGISIFDIRRCIANGKIIRQYERDKPYPSCLVLGRDENENVLHVVASFSEGFACIVTAYRPNPKIWNADATQKIGGEK